MYPALDKLACRVLANKMPQKTLASFHSDLYTDIRTIDTKGVTELTSTKKTFIYVYNGRFPVKITCSPMGMQGYHVDVTIPSDADLKEYVTYS